MNVEEKRPEERLGEYIARVRESRGMSVEELSAATKVAVSYVKSIEAGDWKAFPVAAYVRGYLNSISVKLNLDSAQVLSSYAAESGAKLSNDFADVSDGKRIAPVTEAETRKKSKAVPIAILLLVLAFLVASRFLDLEALAEQASSPAPATAVVVEDTTDSQVIPDGAEVIPADSLQKDSAAVDSTEKTNVVSQAVVDEAVKKSDLPASATIFISSDSKTDSAKVEETAAEEAKAPKTKKTNFLLVGSGESLSWVGLKRRESDNAFLKEANISRAGVKMVYNTTDTLCVTIGDPKAIAKMYLNGVETALPEMKFGRVTRFRVFGGRIVK